MNNDSKNNTKQGVFNIVCPLCNITSFVGFECTEKVYDDTTHGLIGYARRKETSVIAEFIGNWIHCPACDETLPNENLDNIITDITKPQL